MKTFMLGWEFPPHISGGLGTACYGLTKAMDRRGMEVVFVLPKAPPVYFYGQGGAGEKKGSSGYSFKKVSFRGIYSSLQPYGGICGETAGCQVAGLGVDPASLKGSGILCESESGCNMYSGDMWSEVHRYADKAAGIAKGEKFDIVHAHDWMTFAAGISVSRQSGKPLVVHVHSTEFDRSGEHVNQMVYDFERRGMHAANKVITVSNYTKNLVVDRYSVDTSKVEVVYNGVEETDGAFEPWGQNLAEKRQKTVLFLGRITRQKGPEYFLRAAKEVLERMKNVKFIMAGEGDMFYRTIETAAWLGIGHKVLFTRFLRGKDVDRVYRMADLYVMPSVSEPFGIAPLEALQRGVPVLISKQSGVSEKLKNALKVDFWDVNEMANKIIAVLKRRPLQQTLSIEGHRETSRFRWDDSAEKINRIYEQAVSMC